MNGSATKWAKGSSLPFSGVELCGCQKRPVDAVPGQPRRTAMLDLEWSGCVGFEGQAGVGEEAVE